MLKKVEFAWDITEEGCFKYPLVKLPGKVYADEVRETFPVSHYLPEDHSIHMYNMIGVGLVWKLKPEYL